MNDASPPHRAPSAEGRPRPLLHWSPRSPYVRKAMAALHERGLADWVETVRTHADPMIPHPELMRSNPLSKIPTLELADGRIFYGSTVIALWADGEGDGPRLFPSDRDARLTAERDAAFADGLLDIGLSWMLETRLRPEEQRSEALVDVYRRKLNAVADHLERYAETLGRRPVDIGHVSIAVALAYIDFRFPTERWRDGRDALARWRDQFSRRPSMTATTFRDDPRRAA